MKLDKAIVQRRLDLMAAEGVVCALSCSAFHSLTSLVIQDIHSKCPRRGGHRPGQAT
jgi:hypothetical protein